MSGVETRLVQALAPPICFKNALGANDLPRLKQQDVTGYALLYVLTCLPYSTVLEGGGMLFMHLLSE